MKRCHTVTEFYSSIFHRSLAQWAWGMSNERMAFFNIWDNHIIFLDGLQMGLILGDSWDREKLGWKKRIEQLGRANTDGFNYYAVIISRHKRKRILLYPESVIPIIQLKVIGENTYAVFSSKQKAVHELE